MTQDQKLRNGLYNAAFLGEVDSPGLQRRLSYILKWHKKQVEAALKKERVRLLLGLDKHER
jgi:hypothetical protein